MTEILALALSVILVPVTTVYNTYVSRNMAVDIPPAVSGPLAPVRDYAKPVTVTAGSKKAVLMVHGFSGSPRDFGNLPGLFHTQSYDIFIPLLPGHGRGARGLEHVTALEWFRYVSSAYAEIRADYEEVVMIGLSMGGALSVLTAVKHASAPPDKIILLSPFFKVRQEWYYFLPVETYHDLLALFVPWLQSLPGQSAVCRESPHAKRFVKRQYVSTHATHEAFQVAALARQKFERFAGLKIPTLILQSRRDRVVDYETTRGLVEGPANPHIRMITLEKANHVLPRDCEAGRIEQAVMDFTAPVPV